ncbi:NADH-quinone oxidoreductase subunit H [Candidatus Fermentibacterales bacterium]|nr:NADH-quinone oxidoreductase subunit H [Candidatus Fermentibacterales bacterium]
MRIVWLFLSPLIALVAGVLLLGLSRKIMARIHWRYGPPLLQPVIDIIRLFSQRSASHGILFDLGIVVSLAGSLIITLFLPFGNIAPLSGSGGMLVILYMMLIGPLGIALSGGESGNPNASIGISRNLMLAIGYEVPLLMVLLAVMTRYGTISIVEIVRVQQASTWSIASWPLVVSGLAYLLVMPAMLGFRPFEVVQAPQEISSGPMVEYGGSYLALVSIQHALSLYITISLFVNLMLGGSGNIVIFLFKMLVVFVLFLFVNAVFPRFRIEQAVRYLWRWPTLIGLIGLVLVALVGR